MSSQSHNQDVVLFFPPPTCSASWFCPHCCQALKKFMQICNQYCISFLCRCLHQIISNGCMNILIFNLSQKKKENVLWLLCWICCGTKEMSSFWYTDDLLQLHWQSHLAQQKTQNSNIFSCALMEVFPPHKAQEMNVKSDSLQQTWNVLSVGRRSRILIR